MNGFKRIGAIVLAGGMLLACSGCKRYDTNRREINTIDFVRMVGIDTSEEDADKMKVTLELKAEGGGSGGEESGGKQEEKANLISAEGNSFAEAFLQLQADHDKLLDLSHSGFFLIGERAAELGLTPYVDFISRSNQIQFTANIFIVKGGQAGELMKTFGESGGMVSSQLKNLTDKTMNLSFAANTDVVRVMGMLDDAYSGMTIPYLELKQRDEKKSDLEIGGFALFKDTQLVHYADTEASRGINFFRNQVYSGTVPLHDSEGAAVVTRISDAKTKVKTEYERGELLVKVKVEVHTALEETHSTKNLFGTDEYQLIVSQQDQYLKNLILRAVEESKTNQIDALSLANAFRMQHPVIWEDIKQNWPQRVGAGKFDVEVSSRMDRSYDYEEANRSGQ